MPIIKRFFYKNLFKIKKTIFFVEIGLKLFLHFISILLEMMSVITSNKYYC